MMPMPRLSGSGREIADSVTAPVLKSMESAKIKLMPNRVVNEHIAVIPAISSVDKPIGV
jgi:hypothetical protein